MQVVRQRGVESKEGIYYYLPRKIYTKANRNIGARLNEAPAFRLHIHIVHPTNISQQKQVLQLWIGKLLQKEGRVVLRCRWCRVILARRKEVKHAVINGVILRFCGQGCQKLYCESIPKRVWGQKRGE